MTTLSRNTDNPRFTPVIARNARFLLEIAGFVLLGTLLTTIWISVPPVIGVLAVIGIPIILVLTTIFPRVFRNAATTLKALTWWQVLWMMLFVSGLVFRDRAAQNIEANPVDAWALFRIALTGTTGSILLLRLALRKTLWLQKLCHGCIAPLAAYCLVCVVSCMWSVFPAWTLYKSVEMLVDLSTLAAIVATACSAKEYKVFFDWTWTLEILLLMSVWVGALLWPADAFVRNEGVLGFELAGVMPAVNPNSVGEIGAVIGIVAFSRLLRRDEKPDRLWYFLLAAALGTMCVAQARSAILGFVVGMVVVLLASRRFALSIYLALTSTILMAMRNVLGTLSAFMTRGETQEELYTLSNRLDWWTFAWPKILEHPLVGYGAYAGARFFVMAEFKLDAGIHSDWLEVLIGTGLWGFIPAMVALVLTWRQLIKSLRRPWLSPSERQLAIEAAGVLAVLSIRSVFSPALFGHPPVAFLAVLGYAEFLRLREGRRSRNKTTRYSYAVNA